MFVRALAIGNVKKHIFYIFKYCFIYFSIASNNTLQYPNFYNHMNGKSTSIGDVNTPQLLF